MYGHVCLHQGSPTKSTEASPEPEPRARRGMNHLASSVDAIASRPPEPRRTRHPVAVAASASASASASAAAAAAAAAAACSRLRGRRFLYRHPSHPPPFQNDVEEVSANVAVACFPIVFAVLTQKGARGGSGSLYRFRPVSRRPVIFQPDAEEGAPIGREPPIPPISAAHQQFPLLPLLTTPVLSLPSSSAAEGRDEGRGVVRQPVPVAYPACLRANVQQAGHVHAARQWPESSGCYAAACALPAAAAGATRFWRRALLAGEAETPQPSQGDTADDLRMPSAWADGEPP
ncbi:hypothetical protein CDD83_5241 [Cordyceps sp. RAO-2017]|nr:hypothetical protein CDD83_5241 [Cordyceps sp. RAO-2017]